VVGGQLFGPEDVDNHILSDAQLVSDKLQSRRRAKMDVERLALCCLQDDVRSDAGMSGCEFTRANADFGDTSRDLSDGRPSRLPGNSRGGAHAPLRMDRERKRQH
jgi:hypothetical protein